MYSDLNPSNFTKTENKDKLYNCKKYTVISFTELPDQPYLFYKTDGMYSICKSMLGEFKGEIFHPAAWSDVFLWSENK
jgi:hypothetical protein